MYFHLKEDQEIWKLYNINDINLLWVAKSNLYSCFIELMQHDTKIKI